jgi:hypothetical protein
MKRQKRKKIEDWKAHSDLVDFVCDNHECALNRETERDKDSERQTDTQREREAGQG